MYITRSILWQEIKKGSCYFSDYAGFQPKWLETGLFAKWTSQLLCEDQDAQQNWMWIAMAVSKESTETERTEKELSIIDGSF